MRSIEVFVHNQLAGNLTETEAKKYTFEYTGSYSGHPVSLTMPVSDHVFHFDSFPSFFDGLLPEGQLLEGLLRQKKIDRDDYMGQLIAVGKDVVGCVTIQVSRK